jgi:hypothetical protein
MCKAYHVLELMPYNGLHLLQDNKGIEEGNLMLQKERAGRIEGGRQRQAPSTKTAAHL